MTDHCNRRSALIGLCPLCPEIARSYRSRDFGAQKSSGAQTHAEEPTVTPRVQSGYQAVTQVMQLI